MGISKSEVEKLAALSKLQFSDDEIDILIPELEKIISFASEINASESLSEGKEDTEYVLWDKLREDSVRKSLENEKVFQENNAEKGFFVVRKVVG